MSYTINDLKTRRSCRKYNNRQIKDSELNAVLEAGTYAPTGMGKQSPIMVVVQDKETIREIAKLNAEVMGSNTDPFYGAPTIVIVFGDSTWRTYIEDGSLVMGNLLNAAHAIGLGSCWIHRAKEVFQTEEGKKLMEKWGIDKKYVGIGNCILGYPEELAEEKPRKEGYIIRV